MALCCGNNYYIYNICHLRCLFLHKWNNFVESKLSSESMFWFWTTSSLDSTPLSSSCVSLIVDKISIRSTSLSNWHNTSFGRFSDFNPSLDSSQNMTKYGDILIPRWCRLFFCHRTNLSPFDHEDVSLFFIQQAKIFSVLISSLDRTLVLWMTRFSMDKIAFWPQLGFFFHYFIRKFTTIARLEVVREPNVQKISTKCPATSSAHFVWSALKTTNLVKWSW